MFDVLAWKLKQVGLALLYAAGLALGYGAFFTDSEVLFWAGVVAVTAGMLYPIIIIIKELRGTK